MKIVLINSPLPNHDKELNVNEYLPPLGLLYIANNLQNHNIYVDLLDAFREGLDENQILHYLEINHPDYVGTNLFSVNYQLVKIIVESYKYPTIFLIGGLTTKFIYKKILDWQTTNRIIVIIGEAENIIPDIVTNSVKTSPVSSAENRVVFHIDKNSPYFPKDINTVNINRDHFREPSITNHFGQIEKAIITSRGCIYDCGFCGAALSLNKDYVVREMSEEKIVKDISQIIIQYPDTESIRVLDDLFLRSDFSIKKAENIFSNFNISWRAMAHIHSFSQLNDELYTRLVDSKCKELFIGIESGSERIRELINKRGTTKQIIETISRILQVGISVKGYFMYGFPEENKEDMEKTYALANLLVDISTKTIGSFRTSVFQFKPYYGTHLYNKYFINEPELSFRENQGLTVDKGRSMYNLHTKNKSNCEINTINDFIIKTLSLGK